MKIVYHRFLIYLFLAVLWSCSGDDAGTVKPDPVDPDDDTEVPAEKPYLIKEDFEGAAKGVYAAGDVTLKTGIWGFTDALLGNMDADAGNGLLAVRMRNEGSISTSFDIKGLEKIAVTYATYGNDASCTWQLLVAETGKGYQAVGSPVHAASNALQTDTIVITVSGPVRIRIAKSGGNRINIDDVTFIGKGESGIVMGEPGGDEDPDPGQDEEPPRGVTRGDDAPPSGGDNSNLLFGNPSNASGPMEAGNYLIDNYYYTLSYSRDRGIPNWVSWHLEESNFTGETDRLDNFAAFSGLPDGWYPVSHRSYTGSGFNRGHNCPSGDRTSSYNANAATFLMVNMIPQAPNNNQGPWARLENDIRNEVRKGKEAYIIMGSYGAGGDGDNGSKTTLDDGKVTVPANIWKVVLLLPKGDGDLSRVTASTEVIAVDMPNSNAVKADWKQYRTTVDDIEAKTRTNLLSSLREDIQKSLEGTIVVGF